ncbi:MAG: universal stress protein, partial [Chloroflexi bacterium]
MDATNPNRAMADFREARRKAKMQDIMARIKGQPADLLSFDDVSQNFRLEGGSALGVQDIPLDSIVGSVGRYHDFNRQFLPRRDGLARRWTNVQRGAEGLVGLPPIEAYKIGDVYFVVDGNHRVSVARQMESPAIQGKVTEFKTRIPISPEDSPDEIIIKSEYATFLEKTNLDHWRPGTDFSVTAPGRMWVLNTQIEAFRFLKMQESGQDIPYPDAVTRWHDEVYLPVIEAIRENGILRDFPGRTETDLYLWIFQHRAEMEAQLGWDVNLEAAALNLIAEQSDSAERVVARGSEKLLD